MEDSVYGMDSQLQKRYLISACYLLYNRGVKKCDIEEISEACSYDYEALEKTVNSTGLLGDELTAYIVDSFSSSDDPLPFKEAE